MAKSKKSAPSQNNKRQNKKESDISQTMGAEAKKQKSDQSKGNSFDKACYLIEWKMSWTEISDHTRLPEQSLKLQHWIFIEGTTNKMVSTQNANLNGEQQFQIISKDTRSVVIVERLSRNVVKDLNGQIFYLTGKFCNSIDLHFSPTSFEKFKDGFPEDWASIIAEECYRIYQNPVSQGQRTELYNQPAQISSNLDDEDENMSDRSSTISCSDSDDDESYAPRESSNNHESASSLIERTPSESQGTDIYENQPAQISLNLDDEEENMNNRSSTISCSNSDYDGSYAPQESLDNYESKVPQHQPFPVWIYENLNYQITHETKNLIHDKDEPEVEEIAYRLIEIAEQAKEERNKVLNEDAHIYFSSSHQKMPDRVLDNIIKRLEKEIEHFYAEYKSKKRPTILVLRRRLYDILCHLWIHINKKKALYGI